MSASGASLVEGLAQSETEIPFCAGGRLGEIEGSRVSPPCDVRQHYEAMDPLVVDAKAEVRVRDLGGHLRQPGQQERRDIAEPFPKTGDCQNLTTSGAPSSSACSARRSGLFHRFPMTPTLPFSHVMASPGLAEYVTSIRESPVFLTYWAVIG
jgi:hypothetical protein